MDRIRLLDSIGNFGTDLLLIAAGVLFLTQRYTGWTILYIVTVLLCAALPIRLILNIHSGLRQANVGSILLIVFDLCFMIAILTEPHRFMSLVYLFFGWWMLGHGILSMIEFQVLVHDQLPGGVKRFFIGIFSLLVSGIMLLGKSLSVKNDVLSVAAAVFFLVYGLLGLLFHLDVIRSRKNPSLPSWAVSPPILLNAFFPLRVYISLKQLRKDSLHPVKTPEEKPVLTVFIYMKGKGPEIFGHIDLSYRGTILSYGNHDPKNRCLHGTYGDGVLIKADEKQFLQEGINIEGKSVIGYGIRLNEEQRAALESRIEELLSRTVPWKCAAQEAEEAGEDMSGCVDYASRLYKETHCEMYKFSRGKFRTYFVSSTNCVMLADELIRNRSLNLINLTGVATPGAYLSFLNTEYLKPNSIVVSRTLYETKPAHPAEISTTPL